MTERCVSVVKARRPAGTSTWEGYVVAEDEHGTWLFTPRGSERLVLRDGQDHLTTYDTGLLQLAPAGQWWFATWTAAELELDVCRPPEVGPCDVRFTDLKVDLVKDRDGTVRSKDEEQLEQGLREGWISADEHATTLAVASVLRQRLEQGDPVFDELGWRLRDATAGRALPPLPARQTSKR